jgi:hypothetical protein
MVFSSDDSRDDGGVEEASTERQRASLTQLPTRALPSSTISQPLFAAMPKSSATSLSFSVSALVAVLGCLLLLKAPLPLPSFLVSSPSSKMDSADLEIKTTGDHAYFRPAGEEVSGVPKNEAKYHRSPCPALNALANHGYIPRDGKDLTPELLKQRVMDVYNMDPSVARTLVRRLPPHFTLADLGEHGFIEHDASLVHDDAAVGNDPSAVNETLVEELISLANEDQVITKEAVAQHRHNRELHSQRTNPSFDFSAYRQLVTYAEASAFLLGLGDYDTASIPVDRARSFLVKERIPDGFKKSATPVSNSASILVAAQLKYLAYFSPDPTPSE